jgi:TRAP-type C4-dicarboxylate transport system substrate-binding protein
MLTSKSTLFAALAATLALGVTAQRAWTQGAPVEIKYASSAPPKTVWAMQVERFQADVNEASKGSLKVNAFLASQLGSEQDTIQQVARGRIDMGGYSLTAASLIVPELSILAIPFAYKDIKEQDCVLDSKPILDYTEKSLAAKGIQFLGWSEVGTTHFFGKKPILTPDDLRGLKARSQPSKIGAYIWTTFGANPNPLPVTEWNAAHQTGLVDVADSGPTYYHFAGLGKIAPVLTLSAHQDLPGIVIMNKGIYDKLTAEQKNAVNGSRAKNPDAKLRAEVRGFEQKILEMHKQGGGQVVTMTDAQRAVFQKAMEPIIPKIVTDVGGDSQTLWKLVQDGLKTCRK